MEFEFKCKTCGDIHKGMPTFGADKPVSYYEIPEEERNARCDCGSDDGDVLGVLGVGPPFCCFRSFT